MKTKLPRRDQRRGREAEQNHFTVCILHGSGLSVNDFLSYRGTLELKKVHLDNITTSITCHLTEITRYATEALEAFRDTLHE